MTLVNGKSDKVCLNDQIKQSVSEDFKIFVMLAFDLGCHERARERFNEISMRSFLFLKDFNEKFFVLEDIAQFLLAILYNL